MAQVLKKHQNLEVQFVTEVEGDCIIIERIDPQSRVLNYFL